MIKINLLILFFAISLLGCNNINSKIKNSNQVKDTVMEKKLSKFVKVRLATDLAALSTNDKKMLALFFDAADIMNELYWEQAFGDRDKFLSSITDSNKIKYALINYGPWDRLDGNKPFIEGFGDKPKTANFYPADLSKEEFDKMSSKEKEDQNSMVRRDEQGKLKNIPYSVYFKEKLEKVSALLKEASNYTEDKGLKKYLLLRAEALLSDNYYDSDIAWMEMKKSPYDLVIGPIENYEDAFIGIKNAFEAFILIKDKVWSDKLTKYTAMLPDLQKNLPVDKKYKKDVPGTDSDMNVYEAIFYAGDCNAGSKTIAINLPNDEKIQTLKGTRKLQLKNTMKAKFDNILSPIADNLISPEQKKYIKFNAFFENVMFHEVAHSMGVKNTIDGKSTARKALKEQYSALEEAKADIMGLYLVTKLYEKGELKEGEVMDNYVTFLAGIFRSVRFGAASAHGKANMFTFNFFIELDAFKRNPDNSYSVDLPKMKEAVVKAVQLILQIQGDGNYAEAKKLIEEKGIIKEQLSTDLKLIEKAHIPVDVIFEQGKKYNNL